MENSKFDQFLKSKEFRYTAYAFIGVVAFVIVFAAGMLFGMSRIRFSRMAGSNFFYSTNTKPGMTIMFRDNAMPNPYGLIGKIADLQKNSLTIQNQQGSSETVAIDSNTVIKQAQNNLNFSDLKTGELVLVIGKPGSQGNITAHFIRVLSNN